MNEQAASESPAVEVPYGAWFEETSLRLPFPPGWQVRRVEPDDGPEIDDAAIAAALAGPLGCPPLAELVRGRTRAVLAVDDLTRPTPLPRLLPPLLRALGEAGLARDRVTVLVGTASHRPPTAEELARKLGAELAMQLRVVVHDFLGPDVRRIGWIAGGPVELNRHFLDADLRICVGGVIPHNETGFGGGAKMIVPGLAGHATIAHFHGALPPRLAGSLEGPGRLDRRAWAERVAREVGVDLTVCAVVNGQRRLAGVFAGDVVEAHRAAARRARAIGRTRLARSELERSDVVVVNAYPLDTDPVQMGKSVNLAAKLGARSTVVVNAASDGIFYHGMGMGSGVSPARLWRNLPHWLASARAVGTWLRSLARAAPSPLLAARLTYFTLNPLSYAAFAADEAPGEVAASAAADDLAGEPLVFSHAFPEWGLRSRFPRGRLFRDWNALAGVLARRHPRGRALVFPCAPIQLVELE
jgi:nickel-dependent lactate racemase